MGKTPSPLGVLLVSSNQQRLAESGLSLGVSYSGQHWVPWELWLWLSLFFWDLAAGQL